MVEIIFVEKQAEGYDCPLKDFGDNLKIFRDFLSCLKFTHFLSSSSG